MSIASVSRVLSGKPE
ncbi:hypothetical protein ACEQPO_01830 [Bacillus sp. SL00103]